MEGTETTAMENLGTGVSNAIDTISTIMGDALELAVANPLVMIFVASGLVGIGIGLFRKLKKVGK